jgi:hypothetical protein
VVKGAICLTESVTETVVRGHHDHQSGWQGILDRYDVDLVIIERESAMATVLGESPAWRSAFSADTEEVFVRAP